MKNRLGKAYKKLILVMCLLSVALVISSCQSQEPQGVIIEQQAGFGVSYQSMAERDLGFLPPVPGSPEFDKPAEYGIVGIVKNVGGDGAITVIASLAVEGYGTQTNAQRVYLKHNQEERVYFEFISKRGYRHSPKIWCTNSLEDYERYR